LTIKKRTCYEDVVVNKPIVFRQFDGLRLGEGGDFTTNFFTKHAFQIYKKLSYEARNRHFCQTAVSGWAFVSQLKLPLKNFHQ
jgi:hypothetical protein